MTQEQAQQALRDALPDGVEIGNVPLGADVWRTGEFVVKSDADYWPNILKAHALSIAKKAREVGATRAFATVEPSRDGDGSRVFKLLMECA